MKVLVRFILVLLFLLPLVALVSVLKNPHPESTFSRDALIFSNGNAPDSVRKEILQQLQHFQAGYAERDTSQVDSFAAQSFSRENILILGTMPQEVYVGFDQARRLVKNDWASWGDCLFLMDRANISCSGDVAWFATVGTVRFDLSRYLNLPLRLSGVLVKENGYWKFQHLQFQFDLDLSYHFLAIMLLTLGLFVVTVNFIAAILSNFIKNKRCPQ